MSAGGTFGPACVVEVFGERRLFSGDVTRRTRLLWWARPPRGIVVVDCQRPDGTVFGAINLFSDGALTVRRAIELARTTPITGRQIVGPVSRAGSSIRVEVFAQVTSSARRIGFCRYRDSGEELGRGVVLDATEIEPLEAALAELERREGRTA